MMREMPTKFITPYVRARSEECIRKKFMTNLRDTLLTKAMVGT
jgi:hypothetical protein